MYGVYLKCNRCGKTIGGEDVTPKQQGVPTLRRGDGDALRELAAERGWTSQRNDIDYCPDCRQPSSTRV